MTDKELAQERKHIAAALEQSHKEWEALPDKEKKRLQAEAENTRLWEDLTDEDSIPRSDEKQSAR